MAAAASSSGDVTMTDVALRDFTMVKYRSILPGTIQGVAPLSKHVNGPQWLSGVYANLCGEIDALAKVLQDLIDRNEDPIFVAPGMVRAYNLLLQNQNVLYERQSADIQTARRADFHRFEAACTQFAQEVNLALQYVAMTTEERTREQGQGFVRAMSKMAQTSSAQFQKVEDWAVQKEKDMQAMQRRMDKKYKEQDQKLDLLEKKMEQEEVRRQELRGDKKRTAREKAVLRQKADGLEAAISKLTQEFKEGKAKKVKSTLKKAKHSANALSDRLASVNDALTAFEGEKSPGPEAPPPPPLPGPAPPPPSQHGSEVAAPPPQLPKKTPDADAGGGGGKGKGKGRALMTPDFSSSDSSSSNDSDSDGGQTVESYGTMATLF